MSQMQKAPTKSCSKIVRASTVPLAPVHRVGSLVLEDASEFYSRTHPQTSSIRPPTPRQLLPFRLEAPFVHRRASKHNHGLERHYLRDRLGVRLLPVGPVGRPLADALRLPRLLHAVRFRPPRGRHRPREEHEEHPPQEPFGRLRRRAYLVVVRLHDCGAHPHRTPSSPRRGPPFKAGSPSLPTPPGRAL